MQLWYLRKHKGTYIYINLLKITLPPRLREGMALNQSIAKLNTRLIKTTVFSLMGSNHSRLE